MKAKADAVMNVFLGLDKENLEDYLSGSGNTQLAYLEEVLSDD